MPENHNQQAFPRNFKTLHCSELTHERRLLRKTQRLWPHCHLPFNVNGCPRSLKMIPLLLNISCCASQNSEYSFLALPNLTPSICGVLPAPRPSASNGTHRGV